MSVRRDPPFGVKLLAAFAAIDGLWHVVGGLLRVIGGLLGNPIALVVGAMVLALGVAQLAVTYGLWTMEEWGWRWSVRALAFVAALDVLSVLLGQGGLFRLVLTLAVLGYLYSQKSKYVRRSYAA